MTSVEMNLALWCINRINDSRTTFLRPAGKIKIFIRKVPQRTQRNAQNCRDRECRFLTTKVVRNDKVLIEIYRRIGSFGATAAPALCPRFPESLLLCGLTFSFLKSAFRGWQHDARTPARRAV